MTAAGTEQTGDANRTGVDQLSGASGAVTDPSSGLTGAATGEVAIPAAPLAGLVAIVTGGSSGIGRATAVLLAEQGAQVLAVARRSRPLEEVAGLHERIHAHIGDLADPDEPERIAKTALREWGRIDVLVNNAGPYGPAALAGISPADIDRLVRLNIVAPSLLASHCLEALAKQAGSIVNVTSAYAQRAVAGSAHYAATKAALESLTRSWALELAPRGIRVNAISPGPTETGLLAGAGVPADRIEAIKERERQRIPLQRRGDPAEVARWIVALADASAGWITGEVLRVDGGLHLT
ncbi:SDR family NAD(P)-dependent oxidoreductase [Nocardia sp. NPDC056000]|uniref:SDR family NAD(P)-dependent oxidoreductase n=1 Tax=Nocardia sp. NPDC056000 TaxID=3345674 RepID=UPI0035D62657